MSHIQTKKPGTRVDRYCQIRFALNETTWLRLGDQIGEQTSSFSCFLLDEIYDKVDLKTKNLKLATSTSANEKIQDISKNNL